MVRENYRQFFFDKENHGVHLPFHLERKFRKYLTCGIPIYGIARFSVHAVKEDKIVAFSCNGSTLCPSCTGGRTADTAKHLLEEVIPAAFETS
ncbi:MAG: transposase zinc-binding domain-containing protein [Bacteriovorax sp.]|nr:transposase zinc-binding domain-containing protein [Bacteriovorax sp.]